MSRFKNNISILLLAVAVCGTLLSMAHYHSAGLECLDHANEAHYTDNELLCPVCTTFVYVEGNDEPALSDALEFAETIQVIEPLFLSAQPFVPLLGRAPPFFI